MPLFGYLCSFTQVNENLYTFPYPTSNFYCAGYQVNICSVTQVTTSSEEEDIFTQCTPPCRRKVEEFRIAEGGLRNKCQEKE